MNTNKLQGIVPTVAPSWAEFDPTSYFADTTYPELFILNQKKVLNLLQDSKIFAIFAVTIFKPKKELFQWAKIRQILTLAPLLVNFFH